MRSALCSPQHRRGRGRLRPAHLP